MVSVLEEQTRRWLSGVLLDETNTRFATDHDPFDRRRLEHRSILAVARSAPEFCSKPFQSSVLPRELHEQYIDAMRMNHLFARRPGEDCETAVLGSNQC